jgi:hypothetical protein
VVEEDVSALGVDADTYLFAVDDQISPSEQLSIHAQFLVRAAKTGKLRWKHVVRGCGGIWRAATHPGKRHVHT